MWLTVLKGVFSGSFGIVSDYFKGKQENAKQELYIKQQTAKTNNEIKLAQVTKQLDIDGERVRQMEKSWKDEFWLIVFSIPLLNMFISPFIDLVMIGEYKQGMLSDAASLALNNLDTAPTWYIVVILMMTFLSWGYRKGLDQVLSLLSLGKNK